MRQCPPGLRMQRVTWGALGFALVGTIVLLAPLAAATSPPFTATPSFARYGGLRLTGHSVGSAVGSGSNKILSAPSFVLNTGRDRQGQESLASGSGTYSMEIYTGVQNVSFTCGSACATGSHTITIVWNVSWSIGLKTTCVGNGSVAFAAIGLGLQAAVEASSTATVVGSKVLYLYDHGLTTSGTAVAAKKTHAYVLTFTASLTKGTSYTVETMVQSATYAEAVATAGAVCNSRATDHVGVYAPTYLDSIRVG